MSVSEIAAQLTLMKGFLFRRLFRKISFATNSFPVPFSPLISTVARRLLERYREDSGKNSAVALSALRELHAMACRA
jgi:hypothetical protein